MHSIKYALKLYIYNTYMDKYAYFCYNVFNKQTIYGSKAAGHPDRFLTWKKGGKI